LKLKQWDLRSPFSPISVNKAYAFTRSIYYAFADTCLQSFEGGVTTIAPNPHVEHLVAVGRYVVLDLLAVDSEIVSCSSQSATTNTFDCSTPGISNNLCAKYMSEEVFGELNGIRMQVGNPTCCWLVCTEASTSSTSEMP
jgi:hypothetical protein